MTKDEEKEAVFEKIGQFLKKLEVKELIENRERSTYDMPININFESGDHLKLITRILILKEWILIKCCLMFREMIPKDLDIFPLMMAELLKANFDFPEVTYSLDKEENIYIEADMPSDTDFINFESEYNSIMFGVLNFFNKILPNVSKEIKKQNTYTKP